MNNWRQSCHMKRSKKQWEPKKTSHKMWSALIWLDLQTCFSSRSISFLRMIGLPRTESLSNAFMLTRMALKRSSGCQRPRTSYTCSLETALYQSSRSNTVNSMWQHSSQESEVFRWLGQDSLCLDKILRRDKREEFQTTFSTTELSSVRSLLANGSTELKATPVSWIPYLRTSRETPSQLWSSRGKISTQHPIRTTVGQRQI